MIKGLRTVVYKVADLARAKAWYSQVLGIEPYFDEPFYVGYDVGGYELGLDPDPTDVKVGNSVGAYWGVDDVKIRIEEFRSNGIIIKDEPQEVGGGIIVASMIDPFGNVFGIIENPHFKPEEVR
ncbi:MAG: VOC family protein [Pyrinomonadaceae bacterium]